MKRRGFLKGAAALLGALSASLSTSNLGTTPAAAFGKPAPTVMAWYTPQFCAYNTVSAQGSLPTQAQYQQEFVLMQSYGIKVALIDIFSWNVGYGPLNNQAAAANMFAAANAMGTGFKLAFVIDWSAVVSPNTFTTNGVYTILSLGTTTNWATVGAGSTPFVGQTFTATGPGTGNGTAQEAASNAGAMMAAYYNNPAYFYYQNKPFLSAYGGYITSDPNASTFWPACIASVNTALAGTGVTPFFCPVFIPTGFNAGVKTNAGSLITSTSYTITALSTNGGAVTDFTAVGAASPQYVGQQFTATGPGSGTGTAISTSTTNTGMQTNFNVPWLTTPGFLQGLMNWTDLVPTLNLQRNNGFNYLVSANPTLNLLAVPIATSWFGIIRKIPSNSNVTNYESQGYVGMAQMWQAAIAQNSPLVLIGTWNDYTETNCSPISYANFSAWNYPNTSQVTNALWQDHSGFTEMMRYWIGKYIAGSSVYPAKSAIYVAYRQGAQGLANAPNFSGTITWAGDGANYPALDNWFCTTYCLGPGTLTVNTGGSIVNISVPAGLTHSTGAFTAGATQTFTLTIDTKIAVSITGVQIYSSLAGLPANGSQVNVSPWTQAAYAA